MKKENTAIRLKRIMAERSLRQVDILNLTIPYCTQYSVKMNKSDISQYCSKTEPNQSKLFVLGAALNVNEAWLMGYDVPMERNRTCTENLDSFANEKKSRVSYITAQKDITLIAEYHKLNSRGQSKLIETAHEMVCNPLYNDNYQFELAAAHKRTDIDVTPDMIQHDDDIMDDENF